MRHAKRARMAVRRPGPALLVLLLAASGACDSAAPGSGGAEGSFEPALYDELDARASTWVDETLASLSLRERIAQLVVPWIPGAYASSSDASFRTLERWVTEEGIGGVVISIGSPHSYASLLNRLQNAARVPLLVTADFENGGPGMRVNHSYALPTLLPQGGGTSFPPHDGLRRHRRPGVRVRVRAHHGGGGAGARRPPELRPGPRRQFQSREPHHQHPSLRRGPGGGGGARSGVHRGCARRGRAHHRQALSGSRRHPHRLAHRAPGGGCGQGAAGGDGTGAVPAGRVRRRGRGDDRPRRGARHPGRRRAGDALALLPDRTPARGHGVRRPGLHRCPADGRHLARIRRGRGGGAGAGSGLRRAPRTRGCGRGHRRGGGRGAHGPGGARTHRPLGSPAAGRQGARGTPRAPHRRHGGRRRRGGLGPPPDLRRPHRRALGHPGARPRRPGCRSPPDPAAGW